MAKAGYKRQPSPWPTAAFILIKFFQFFCAVLILGILAFFCYHLREDKYPIPWQFAVMAATSAGILILTFVESVLFCMRRLPPLFPLIAETLLSIIQAFSVGALGRGLGGNIVRQCSHWRTTAGITTCHLFKTLFAFGILMWFVLFAGVILASSVRKRTHAHKYVPANSPAPGAAPLVATTEYKPHAALSASEGANTNTGYGNGGTYNSGQEERKYGNTGYYS